jgi:hypothetical protein
MAKKKVEEKVLKEDPDYDANVSSIQTHPTKTAAMGALMDIFQKLSHEQALNFLNLALSSIGNEASGVPDGAAAHNVSTIAAKPSDAMRETYEADVLALFGDNKELAEEHKEKVLTLFEAALNARESALRVTIEEEYNNRLDEETDAITSFFEENIDTYLTYGMSKWLEENKIEVQNAVAAEKAQEFFEDLIELCRYHNVSVPEDKIDVVEGLTSTVDKLKADLNEAVDIQIQYSKELEQYKKAEILESVANGLPLTQKEKLKTMVESFSLDEDFAEKVKTVREQHFPLGKKGPTDTGIITEEVNEDTTPKKQVFYPGMDNMVKQLSSMSKRIAEKKSR